MSYDFKFCHLFVVFTNFSVECKACRFKVQSGAMEHHRTTSCGKRSVPCSYCELELPKSDMADHENYCGARTERCDECAELVMLKYKKLHIDSNHGFLKLDDGKFIIAFDRYRRFNVCFQNQVRRHRGSNRCRPQEPLPYL